MESSGSSYKDYYYILGISPNATHQEIQEAYEELFNRFGPHVSIMGQDPDSMLKAYKDICEAYEVLTDPVKRKSYDETNTPHLEKAHLRQLWGKIANRDSTGSGIPAVSSPDATRMEVSVTLREAIKGTTRKLRIEEHIPCKNCVSLKPVQRMKCDQCHGTGHTQNVRMEQIVLAAKVFDGQELIIPNRGRWDLRNNRNLDLVAVVKVQPHPIFIVSERDISCTVPITILEAVLGAEIQAPTATGKVTMKIQPLTQSGRVYRLKGLGLGGGDYLISIQIVVPPQISLEELELYRKLLAITPHGNPREELFRKVAESDDSTGNPR